MSKKAQKIAVWAMVIIMVVSVVGSFIIPLITK